MFFVDSIKILLISAEKRILKTLKIIFWIVNF